MFGLPADAMDDGSVVVVVRMIDGESTLDRPLASLLVGGERGEGGKGRRGDPVLTRGKRVCWGAT